MVEKKYVDVNVFAYWLGAHPEFGTRAREWVESINEAKHGEYITSTLTLYELAVIMAGLLGTTLKNRDLIETITKALLGLHGLEILPLEISDIVRALEFMKLYELDYEDAIHLAVALRGGAKKIISNDKDFDKTPLERTF